MRAYYEWRCVDHGTLNVQLLDSDPGVQKKCWRFVSAASFCRRDLDLYVTPVVGDESSPAPRVVSGTR